MDTKSSHEKMTLVSGLRSNIEWHRMQQNLHTAILETKAADRIEALERELESAHRCAGVQAKVGIEQETELFRLRAALAEIQEGKGRFSMDHHEHACNTIEDMKELARIALSRPPEQEPSLEQIAAPEVCPHDPKCQ